MTEIVATIDSEFHRVSAAEYTPRVSKALKDFVNDTAEAIERIAKINAPVGPTGRLKAAGVIRSEGVGESIFGDGGVAGSFVDPTSPAFGGGFSVRGGYAANRGQYSGVDKWNKPGHIFSGSFSRSSYQATVTLNPAVEHAKWVHEGTGIYGPRGVRIEPVTADHLVFRIHGQLFVKKSVAGQKAKPFLTDAFKYVSNFTTPARLTELRAEIAAGNLIF